MVRIAWLCCLAAATAEMLACSWWCWLAWCGTRPPPVPGQAGCVSTTGVTANPALPGSAVQLSIKQAAGPVQPVGPVPVLRAVSCLLLQYGPDRAPALSDSRAQPNMRPLMQLPFRPSTGQDVSAGWLACREARDHGRAHVGLPSCETLFQPRQEHDDMHKGSQQGGQQPADWWSIPSSSQGKLAEAQTCGFVRCLMLS